MIAFSPSAVFKNGETFFRFEVPRQLTSETIVMKVVQSAVLISMSVDSFRNCAEATSAHGCSDVFMDTLTRPAAARSLGQIEKRITRNH
ncbi:hypothetical protein HPB50_016567 [Hyalomma asiaticum]|uniref:Uncharacterized protein n=1 Tax=Hyalomma asiaticum TaxID=266040 RepID=A0ACB7SZG3_HYAAI|nr:hypothetical protein HPB50_016567 [Hyalomma asiaticum]